MTKKQKILLLFFLVTAVFFRFYGLMRDAPYFFDPDERNMANAISQFRLPANLPQIPICLISQLSPISTNDPGSSSRSNDPGSSTTNCNLNPHFFSYGQFPLYLAYSSDQAIKLLSYQVTSVFNLNDGSIARSLDGSLSTSFPSAIFWLRFWSAISSVLTVFMVYLIAKKLFGNWKLEIGHFAAILAAFSPGLIQAAHFGTTESLLAFFFLASIYFSLSYLSNLGHLKFIILTSFVIGLSLGSKFTGVFFIVPPAITIIIRIIEVFRERRRGKIIGLPARVATLCVAGGFLLIGSVAVFAFFSPYNLVEPENAKSAVFGYESDVATGRYEAFYTRQFVNTTPIVFQAEKIFPYVLGWPVFILGSIGFLLMLANILSIFTLSIIKSRKYHVASSKRKNLNIDIPTTYSLLLITSFLIYLLPNAFLFAKWTRFMTPILPFFSIFAAITIRLLIEKLKNSLGYWVIGLLVFISLLPGLMFMSIYTHEDSRVTASKWIYKNIPDNSYILSETANVVDIPLGLPGDATGGPPAKTQLPSRVFDGGEERQDPASRKYQVISFDFYHLDENPMLFEDLINHLTKADYIFIPSRRIFANYPKLPQEFPLVTKYYQLLFSGALGFEKVSEISSFPQLPIINYQLPDEQSEETFTVFDHPVIRVYRKVEQLTLTDYRNLFEN